MALAVDSAERLLKEIFRVFSSVRDGLAIIGALYAVKKSLGLSLCACKTLREHVIARLVPVNLRVKYGTWAVVTGCTSGIGLSFCEELATRGIHLVLVSRNPDKLKELSQHIESKFDVQTLILAVDFNEGRSVYDVVRKGIEGRDIGILINNVGVMYDYPMDFTAVSEEKLWQLVNINVAAATMMTHIVLPGMVERGRGAVVNMGSGASNVPTPLISVYSATKAYLDYFSRAVNYEYQKHGVTVQCLMPYYIATRMTRYSKTLSKPSILIPKADTFVRSALCTLGWTSRTTGYLPHTMQLWFARLIPDWLYMWGAMRLNAALRHQAETRIRHRSGSLPHSRPASSVFLSASSSTSELLARVPSSSSSEYVDAPTV